MSVGEALAETNRMLERWAKEPLRAPPLSVPLIEEPGGKVIELVCGKCTRTASILGESLDDCREEAQRLGWVKNGAVTICPKCPAMRER